MIPCGGTTNQIVESGRQRQQELLAEANRERHLLPSREGAAAPRADARDWRLGEHAGTIRGRLAAIADGLRGRPVTRPGSGAVEPR
jgi:hypothetical protein